MNLKRIVIYILLFAFIIVSACSAQTPEEPVATEAAAQIEPTATLETKADDAEEEDDDQTSVGTGPESPLDQTSPLSAPEAAAAPEQAPEIVAEFDEETGAVTGLLRARHADGDVRPLSDAVIGLGELVENDLGEGKVGAAYSPSDSPRATIDAQGIFVINNVKPGDYALILDAIVTQSLMSLPDDSGDFFVEVIAGEQIDLGILEYETLSYPGFVK